MSFWCRFDFITFKFLLNLDIFFVCDCNIRLVIKFPSYFYLYSLDDDQMIYESNFFVSMIFGRKKASKFSLSNIGFFNFNEHIEALSDGKL